MNTHTHHIIRHLALLAAGLMVTLTSANAANYTWSGGGGDNYWSTGANWGGSAPGVTGQALFFAGSTRLTPDNTNVTSLNGITFNAGAGSFTLKGNSFTLHGDIANNSGVLQTIENAMTLNNNRTIDTGSGGITLKGGVGETGGSRILNKTGAGTLTLAGANTFTGNLYLYQGRILLDAGAGGSLAAGNYLVLGGNGATVREAYQGGVFEVRGAASGTTTVTMDKTLFLGKEGGAMRLIVDSFGGDGTTLVFSNFSTAGLTTSDPTLNVDLSSTNSALRFSNTTALVYGIYKYVTVTDANNTGFATRDVGTGYVTRLTNTTDLPTAGTSFSDQQANRHTSGNLTLTGDVAANSLTIQGTGLMSGGAYELRTRAILVEEGIGNYTISNAVAGSDDIVIHQYSTNGVLKIAGDLVQTGTGVRGGYNITKAGPGTLIFEGTAQKFGGGADIQSGLLQLDGSFEDVALVHVRDGGILSGRGQIGGGTTWDENNPNPDPRQTQVNVWSGGTLDATHSTTNALRITGTLALYAGSTFQVDLAGGSFDALSVVNTNLMSNIVTLNGDLKLTLNYAPTLGEDITLLTTTNGLITGTFATINGLAATTNFSIGSYNFDLHYDSNKLWLDTIAVPEPSTVILLLLAGTLGLACRRRKS